MKKKGSNQIQAKRDPGTAQNNPTPTSKSEMNFGGNAVKYEVMFDEAHVSVGLLSLRFDT